MAKKQTAKNVPATQPAKKANGKAQPAAPAVESPAPAAPKAAKVEPKQYWIPMIIRILSNKTKGDAKGVFLPTQAWVSGLLANRLDADTGCIILADRVVEATEVQITYETSDGDEFAAADFDTKAVEPKAGAKPISSKPKAADAAAVLPPKNPPAAPAKGKKPASKKPAKV